MENPPAKQPQPKPFNQCLLIILICLMIITGSTNTIATKILTTLKGLDASFGHHEWFITYGMFIGECFSLFIYISKKTSSKTKPSTDQQPLLNEDGQINANLKKPEASFLIFALTATCDMISSTLSTFAITFLSSSLYQMFRGIELFFIMIFSKTFLKNPIYAHHALGVGTVIFGLILVGLNAILYENEGTNNPIAGMTLLLCAQLFSSTQYTLQELFVKRYNVNSFQLVGFEGMWGTLEYSIILVIFQFVSCDHWSNTLQEGLCCVDENNKWKLENVLYALRQMNDNYMLICVYIIYICSIALYNIIGINLTKLASSTARAVVDTVRTVFVWMYFAIPWDLRPEGSEEKFWVLKLVGFAFLVCGTLVYNEIVVIKVCNLDYNTRVRIAEREREKIMGPKIGEDDSGEGDKPLFKEKNIDTEGSASEKESVPDKNDNNV